MNEHRLYLLPGWHGAADACWPVSVRTAQGKVLRSTLGDLPAELATGRVTLIVPMERVGCCEAGPVPGRRPSHQTLAYAVEEQLAAPLETLHLAFGPADERGFRSARVIDLELFDNLLSLLRAQRVEPHAVHADADLLPDEQACALWLEGRWLVGGNAALRLAASPQAAQVLRQTLPELCWLAEAQEKGAEPLCNQRIDDAFAVLAQGAGMAIDLRQGPFRRRRGGMPWQGVAGGVLVALLATGLADQWRADRVVRAAEQVRTHNIEAFERWRPGQPIGPDLAAQARALEHRPRPQTAIERLSVLSEQLLETGNLMLERTAFSQAEGWRLDVVSPGFDELEHLGRRMPSVRVEHARQASDGVRATLTWGAVE